jgi:hypothetical protein
VRSETPQVLEMFEKMFDHRSFTGRSGTFFGYEGLGCIFWHMVSKLRLAAQGSCLRAGNSPFAEQLAECYANIRAGIADFKTPENFGAFPMDPYSHTPAHTGARQPGLTGQVKEDILCRFGELGVYVVAGKVHFNPQLLRRDEFLKTPAVFDWFDLAGTRQRIRLPPFSLAFTCWQTPVVYRLGRADSLTLVFADGLKKQDDLLQIDAETSRSLFKRTGKIQRIEVTLSAARFAPTDRNSMPRSSVPILKQPKKYFKRNSRFHSNTTRRHKTLKEI